METHRILVLGGTGRVATLLRRAWHRAPPALPVTWQTRQPLPDPQPDPGWIRLDPLADPDALAAACAGVSVLIDLTGRVRGTETDLAENTALAATSLAAADAAGVGHVFLASSAAVYGPVSAPAAEDAPLAPANPYGASKAAMEAFAESWAAGAGRPGVTCLRIGNVAGADALLGGVTPGRDVVLDRFTDGSTPARSYAGPETFAMVLARLVDLAVAGSPLPFRLNLAAPGVVQMGALLDAAGIAWTPRLAAAGALPALPLDTTLLAGMVPFQGDEGTARRIAAEWARIGNAR